MLGIYNGQNTSFREVISNVAGEEVEETSDEAIDFEIRVRTTAGVEYVKVVLFHGRIVGAILCGEAADDLGTTLENLILSQNVVGHLDFLNPEFDLDDYFD